MTYGIQIKDSLNVLILDDSGLLVLANLLGQTIRQPGPTTDDYALTNADQYITPSWSPISFSLSRAASIILVSEISGGLENADFTNPYVLAWPRLTTDGNSVPGDRARFTGSQNAIHIPFNAGLCKRYYSLAAGSYTADIRMLIYAQTVTAGLNFHIQGGIFQVLQFGTLGGIP